MKTGVGAGLLFISPVGKHLRYVLRLHFPASNNVAEYEALVNGLRIAVELGVRCLDARGDSQLVIDQVMKNSHCRDPKMEAYCDEVRRCDGTSQVIRPTYSCPCLTDIRHPVDVPKSLEKFGIFPYLSRNVSPVLQTLQNIRGKEMRKRLHNLHLFKK
jgi:hypothetical protein